MVMLRAAVFCWNICVLDITLQKTAFTFIVVTLASHKETCSLYAVALMVQLVEPLLYKVEGLGDSIPDGVIEIFIYPNPVTLWPGGLLSL